MSDSDDTKGRSIPSWQRRDSSSSSGTVPDSSGPSSPDDPQRDSQRDPHPSRAALLNQADKFLQDDDIRDAPIERKRAFLQSKGLSNLEIEELLPISPNEDKSSDEGRKQLVKELQVSRTMPDLKHVLTPSYSLIQPNRQNKTVL